MKLLHNIRAKNNAVKEKYDKLEVLQCYLMISMQIIGLLVVTIYPICWAIRLAWYYYDGVISTTRFVGFQNFITIFTKDTVTLTLVAEKTAAIDNNIKETGKNNIDNPLLKGYIYGLDTRLKAADLDEYLAVEGDGRLEYVLTKYKVAGTGTVVNVYDRNDTPDDISDDILVEQYIIVIYGDVNGDADIDATDYSIVTDNNLGLADWANYDDAVDATNENYNHAMVLAANLNDDANVDGTDAQLINDVSLYAAEINQQTGEVIYY